MEGAVQIMAVFVQTHVLRKAPRIEARKDEQRKLAELVDIGFGPGGKSFGAGWFVAMDSRGKIEPAFIAERRCFKVVERMLSDANERTEPDDSPSGKSFPAKHERRVMMWSHGFCLIVESLSDRNPSNTPPSMRCRSRILPSLKE